MSYNARLGVEAVIDGRQGTCTLIDPGLFAQVVTNLIMNSLTHAFEAGQSGRVRIHYRPLGERLQLVYQDDGRGIDAQVLGRIFEPYSPRAGVRAAAA